MEEELRTEVRVRRERSIQLMVRWLEQQELANAGEGTPREALGEHEDRTEQDEDGAWPVESVEPGQRLVSEFFLRR
jgi:hypothetical protein